ncbi:MAG: alpha/beta fold hydrolase [Gemmatimonadales bacterium]|nr:MAG: alpha/beta fold hydrolase [Gemmatimonadales bacterium]
MPDPIATIRTALILIPFMAMISPPPSLAAQEALAEALLRVEYALAERPPQAEEVAELNQRFDRATLAFFAGQQEAVLQAMDELAARIEPDEGVRAGQAERARATVEALPARGRTLDRPTPLPYRLHWPELEEGDRWAGPLPVVVALHGAGGNEHMFLEAYGAGRLPALADALGFVVISPSTPAMAADPGALGALLDAAAEEGAIDRDRVYLVGHSMGAGAAWSLATRQPDAIRAVACIAGPCGGGVPAGTGATLPPLLAVAGGLDPLAAPDRMQAAAEAGRREGVQVDLRVMDTQGHTLIVGAVLDEVMTWLLERVPH